MRFLIVVFGLFLALVGCVTPLPDRVINAMAPAVSIYEASEKQTEKINTALKFFPLAVQDSVHSITVRQSLSHDGGKAEYGEIAHCHEGNDGGAIGAICLKNRAFNILDVFHEAAHAYTRRKLGSGDFPKRWQTIAGDVYKKRSSYMWSMGDLFPKDGCLTYYGRFDWEEDVAEWVVMLFAYEGGFRHRLVYIDKADLRYRKKLLLLFEYGLIHRDTYLKARPLFE